MSQPDQPSNPRLVWTLAALALLIALVAGCGGSDVVESDQSSAEASGDIETPESEPDAVSPAPTTESVAEPTAIPTPAPTAAPAVRTLEVGEFRAGESVVYGFGQFVTPLNRNGVTYFLGSPDGQTWTELPSVVTHEPAYAVNLARIGDILGLSVLKLDSAPQLFVTADLASWTEVTIEPVTIEHGPAPEFFAWVSVFGSRSPSDILTVSTRLRPDQSQFDKDIVGVGSGSHREGVTVRFEDGSSQDLNPDAPWTKPRFALFASMKTPNSP